MGSEKKSKGKTRKRGSPSQSEDDEGGHSKKHRGISDEHRGSSSNRDKHHKSRHTKKEKSEKRKKQRSKHNGHSASLGYHSGAEFKELSKDDYYSKNNEFATWLKEERKKFFSDLSSDSARELFSDFVDSWNSKKLSSKYYEGIATGPRSSHNWKIRN